MQLEEDLGAKLFTRTKQRMKINDNGTNAYHIAQKILGDYENLKKTLISQSPHLQIRRIGSYAMVTARTANTALARPAKIKPRS